MSSHCIARSRHRSVLSKQLTCAALLTVLVAGACHKSKGAGVTPIHPTVHPELLRVEYGRIVDVYGLRVTPEGSTIELVQRDVMIGPDIQDERETDENKGDEEILYDFIGSDPDALQPRLFIPRDLNAAEFKAALAAVDDNLREVAPMLFGSNTPGLPFGVVPRNAALRLTFSTGLGVDDSFFVERGDDGRVIGLRNTSAVQLLRIDGDPTQPGNMSQLPVRIAPQGHQLILDPVLLGSEGLQYQTRNRASGMPESPDQTGANIRIALALDGPLAIPGLREPHGLRGFDNNGTEAIVRDFRSGNRNDNSADMANGFVRDPLPLRIVGEITMYLEKVERINSFTHEITIFKNGLSHEIDRGDVFRIITDSSGVPLGSAEVVVDPSDDSGAGGTQHVRVRIRHLPGLEAVDPRHLAGYPASVTEREPWLVQNAPRAVCIAEFSAGDGVTNGDDPRNFLTFTPTPLPNLDGSPSAANANVSPFAGAIVRFTKPVAMATVRWADTFFFAMRDLTTQQSIDEFIASRPNSAGGTGMEPTAFVDAKYRTPFLIGGRVFDEDNSATALRLQPSAGFYLDDRMRDAPPGTDHRYFLHLIANSTEGGVRDLAGNAIDLQGSTVDRSNSVVIPFTVDTRRNGAEPFFPDNLSVSVVRRFAHRDEDAQPSYFMGAEVPAPGVSGLARGYPLDDLFGGFIYIDGKIQARPSSRTRQIADDLNQAPVDSQASVLRWCPVRVGSENQRATNSSTNMLTTRGLQNPLNPYGCRMQTLWRDVDLSLSRSDPFEFNLDVEQMYWAPFTASSLIFDEFDRTSLFLGHSEQRPAPCVGDFSALPSLPTSGLRREFQRNFVWNPKPIGSGTEIDTQPLPHPAYVNTPLTINAGTIVYEPNQVNRFLPLPEFKKPYFVFRDETVAEQGCDNGQGRDVGTNTNTEPYIVSPFNNGLGSRWLTDQNVGAAGAWLANSFWNDLSSWNIGTGSQDPFTGGLVGTIALPLLADFWTYCDSSELPAGNGYIALGLNGWQVALTVQSSPRPDFRIVTAGRAGANPICRSPGDPEWSSASGWFNYNNGLYTQSTEWGDNTLYWIMIDMMKRQSVITNGFVDLNNPHRVPEGFADPRLGPFYLSNGQSTVPNDVAPSFAFEFDPPLTELPGGTSVVAQFRGAGVVDPSPWYWAAWMQPAGSRLYPAPNGATGVPGYTTGMRNEAKPTADNFPLDPYIAGDAHIRKWDKRGNRNWWTHFYNKTVTAYADNPNLIVDPAWTAQFAAPNEQFTPQDVRYLNWRFVTTNNVDASPAVAPTIDTFSLSWRYQRQ